MLDIIIGIILIFFGLLGSRRGIINAVITFLSTLGALVLSFIIYPLINIILKLTPVYGWINEKVTDRIGMIDFGTGLQSQEMIINETLSWLPMFIREGLIKNNNMSVYKTLGVQNVLDYLSVSITNIIVSMITVFVIWFILKCILVGGAVKFGKAIAKLPVISSVDHLGGFILGIVKGLLTLWIIALIIPVVTTMPFNFEEYIQGTILVKWLYENNLVLYIFEQVF